MRAWCAAALTMATFSVPPAACAHAFLDHASPRVGSTIAVAPTEVTLWFTERLEPAFCSARVEDSAGRPVEAGKATVNDAQPDRLVLSLRPLPPGRYRVVWRVLSVDTHVTEGDYTFSISPGAAKP
jgi:methionine-rich copper-binding protein CopC